MVAGVMITGFILVEVRILNRGNSGADNIDAFYLALGILVFALSAIIWFQ